MYKIISYFKKHKKVYLSLIFIAVAGLVGFLSWDYIQFKYYCREKELCSCAAYKLTADEKKAFVAIAKYMKKTGSANLDAGILRYTTADILSDVGLKMKACSAEVIRQTMLNNNMANRANFPGDYNCMRQTIINDLSNEEILFLQSPQSKSLEALHDPIVREMYLNSSAKLMKCMNEQVQKQYMDEVEKIKKETAPKKRRKKVDL